ncbi:hypothetical protein C8A05DRAFT_30630 [Staphylotrichum tortipilum]|uniref:Uncharacterized protein n=1 Tax=Staphylotrichum tortipilum TaxID=2831512 RepID=A0AAN6MS30_9PEZI|nr:hypothetical protein C8A05DRAFT_30630 [Staphylotrichum longicolle]
MARMSLRASSLRRVPGRYQEDLGPSRADRPLFAHPDVPFDPVLVASCAHPSLPLDHPGLGPSEAERARRAAAAAASGREEGVPAEGVEEVEGDQDCGGVGGRGNGDESQSAAGPAGGLEELAANLAISDANPRGGPQQRGDSAPVSARPAHVAKISRVAGTAETTAPDASNSPCPRWANLPKRIRYAIIHDMTQTALLSDVVLVLGLSAQEVAGLLQLIEEERVKHQRYGQVIREFDETLELPPDEEMGLLWPVTEGITGGEVGRGRAFLRAIGGAEPVAAALGFWQGTSGDFHNIAVDKACVDLAAPARDPREDLLARFAPPANTVNPHGLECAASPSHAEDEEETEMPPPGDLHHARWSGAAFPVFTESDWLAWRGLTEENPAVISARALVPEALSVLAAQDFLAAGELGDANTEDAADPETAPPPSDDAVPASPHNLASVLDPAGLLDPDLLLGPAFDPYPNAPADSPNPFDNEDCFGLFVDHMAFDSDEEPALPQPAAASQQHSDHGVAAPTTAAAASSSQTVEEQVAEGNVVVENLDVEMGGVHDLDADTEIDQDADTEMGGVQTPPHLNQYPRWANPFNVNEYRNQSLVSVRSLDPELAASVAETLARHRARVHFDDDSDESTNRRRRGRGGDSSDEEVLAPVSKNDNDDGEYRPSGTGMRKASSRGRAPTGRGRGRPRTNPVTHTTAAGPVTGAMAAPTATASTTAPFTAASFAPAASPQVAGTRKRGHDQSSSADPPPRPPKRARAAPATPAQPMPAGDGNVPAVKVKRPVGRPRKYLRSDAPPNPPATMVSNFPAAITYAPTTMAPSPAAAMALNPSAAVMAYPPAAMAPNPPVTILPYPGATMATPATMAPPLWTQIPAPPTSSPARELLLTQPLGYLPNTVQPRSTNTMPTQPSVPQPSVLQQMVFTQPAATTYAVNPFRVPAAQIGAPSIPMPPPPMTLTDPFTSAQPVAPPSSFPSPTTSEGTQSQPSSQQPAARQPKKRGPKPKPKDESTPHQTKGRKPKIDAEGNPIVKPPPRDNLWGSPSQILRSNSGEELTRVEFGQRFPQGTRHYRPGGLSGGRYEIPATGEVWTFMRLVDKPPGRRKKAAEVAAARAAAAAGDSGGSQGEQTISASGGSQQSSAHGGDAGEQQATMTTAAPLLTLGLTPPGGGGHTRLTDFTNQPCRQQPTPTRPSVAHPTPPTLLPAISTMVSTPQVVAARVAELGARCRQYNLQTRAQFNSDTEFLGYAESMLPLLYPYSGAGHNGPAASGSQGGGGGASGGGNGGFGAAPHEYGGYGSYI